MAALRLRLLYRLPANLPPTLVVGGVIVALFLALAVLGPLIAPFDPQKMGAGRPQAGVDWVHWFGTDKFGRDVFSRVLAGTRIVLALALSGTVLGLVLGAALGLVSAFVGGWVDEVLQRFFEAMISIPFIMLALLAIAAAGPENGNNPVIIATSIAVVYLPRIGRMARAAALDIVSQDYVLAARLRGEPAWSVVRREILPNASGVLLVEFALRAGYAPVLVGALAFLGFGLRPQTPEWGLMIVENRSIILANPFAAMGPAIALAVLVIGLNLFTDGVARLLGRPADRGV